MKTKKCTGDCGQELPATTEYFYKQSEGKYGVTACCIKCTLEKQKKHYHVPENKKRRRNRQKIYEQENKEKINARRRIYERLEHRKEHRKEYDSREETKQRRRKWEKEHRLKNSGKYKANKAKRRASKKNQTPDYTNYELIARIYDACPKGYEVDHIKPIAQGGLHHESNLCYLPRKINRSKAAKTIEEFGEDVFNQCVIYWQDVLLVE